MASRVVKTTRSVVRVNIVVCVRAGREGERWISDRKRGHTNYIVRGSETTVPEPITTQRCLFERRLFPPESE